MNKAVFVTGSIAILLFLFSFTAQAQCREFAKETGIQELDTANFIHDGRFNAIKLRQGDEIELFKTVSAGIDYRIVVCGSDELPAVPFQILDYDRNVIFTNEDNSDTRKWDFSSASSQRLIVSIRIPPSSEDIPESGCVAILFGLKK